MAINGLIFAYIIHYFLYDHLRQFQKIIDGKSLNIWLYMATSKVLYIKLYQKIFSQDIFT